MEGLAFVSALLILNDVYHADIMRFANTFVLGVFVLEWPTLVHYFFVLFIYGSIGENTLYRDLEANREIQQVYIPIANDVFGILTK